MKQFYETYVGDEFVSPLVTQISWTNPIVEYALSRSMSQMLVSNYVFELPDKKILKQRLKEITSIALNSKK